MKTIDSSNLKAEFVFHSSSDSKFSLRLHHINNGPKLPIKSSMVGFEMTRAWINATKIVDDVRENFKILCSNCTKQSICDLSMFRETVMM